MTRPYRSSDGNQWLRQIVMIRNSRGVGIDSVQRPHRNPIPVNRRLFVHSRTTIHGLTAFSLSRFAL